ncbi:MAG TPA: hypothetical protein VIS04_05260 [Woeseiaceae bacterium]
MPGEDSPGIISLSVPFSDLAWVASSHLAVAHPADVSNRPAKTGAK